MFRCLVILMFLTSCGSERVWDTSYEYYIPKKEVIDSVLVVSNYLDVRDTVNTFSYTTNDYVLFVRSADFTPRQENKILDSMDVAVGVDTEREHKISQMAGLLKRGKVLVMSVDNQNVLGQYWVLKFKQDDTRGYMFRDSNGVVFYEDYYLIPW